MPGQRVDGASQDLVGVFRPVCAAERAADP